MPDLSSALRRTFRDEISSVSELEPGKPAVLDPLSLTSMARAALNYLRGNPEPTRDFECKFTLGPLGIPCHFPEWCRPNQYAYDPISLGDTDARMSTQYANMREMSGEPSPCPIELGVHRRIESYMGAENLCWVNPAAAVGHAVEGEYALNWTTAKLMWRLAEQWERERDETAFANARRLFEGLRDMTEWKGDRAWHMGIAPWKDRTWLLDGWCESHGRNYPFIVEPLVRYWECTGDDEALDLAKAFAEGFLDEVQPDMGTQRIDPESGAFTGHVHLHTHAVWGVAHLGAVLGEKRYLDWAASVYRFVVDQGTDWGWYPEFVPQGEYRSEVCVVGDMVSLGAWLARGLSPDYWDQVERTVRNKLRRSQFFLTPEFVALFEHVHRDKPALEVDAALRELRRLEGGFVAQTTFDDWVSYPGDPHLGAPGISRNGIHMMGCCPPEGMRGLWEAWRGTVLDVGNDVYINLCFTREHPAARVTACRPADGRLEVVALKTADFHLRPPAWAERTLVGACRNGQPAPVVWGGPADAYVVFAQCAPGDELVISWAVPAFSQSFAAKSIPGREQEVRARWVGNEVVAVEPRAEHLSMFNPEPRK
ncbi:MAG: hypothetical protein HPY44_14270 [Armatimonadetes bacterium]|nr:hypothetical protein [Armatimonadota bacterium]